MLTIGLTELVGQIPGKPTRMEDFLLSTSTTIQSPKQDTTEQLVKQTTPICSQSMTNSIRTESTQQISAATLSINELFTGKPAPPTCAIGRYRKNCHTSNNMKGLAVEL